MKQDQESIIQLLPRYIRGKSNDFKEFGIHDPCWGKSDMLTVVKFLEPLGIAILGGDVLQRKNDIVQYTYDNWYVANKDSGSDWQEYVALSCKTAQDYITKYPEGNRIIYYAAVMASLEIYQHLPDH